jgi:hypothetical protein
MMVACAWALAFLAGPSRVEASGCHAPSRPVFGVELLDDVTAKEPGEQVAPSSSSALSRPPCSGEVPGPVSSHVTPTPPAAMGPDAWVERGLTSEPLDRGPDKLALPRPVLGPPVRPPRS